MEFESHNKYLPICTAECKRARYVKFYPRGGGKIDMEEYSRIIIEEYCMNHPKTKKADFLWEMVHMSYDVACEPDPWQLMRLSQLISRERNPELREALEDLDEFMNGY